MTGALDDSLKSLEKHGRVYIHNSRIYNDPRWNIYQEREKEFWNYELARPTYHPDPVQHIQSSLRYWGIGSDFFRGDKAVLEIGSGPLGFFAGIDRMNKADLPADLVISDSLMDFYQHFAIASLFPANAILLRSPGEDMPFPNNSFDIIVTNNTIDHVQDCRLLLSEIMRLLKPNGTLLFSSHVIADPLNVLRPILGIVDKNHPHHFSAEGMRRLFDASGFSLDVRAIVPLCREEAIPAEINTLRRPLYYIGFRIFSTLYGIAKSSGGM